MNDSVPTILPTQKTCCTCQQPKPLEEFYANCKAKDGKQSSCKECHKAHSRDQNLNHKARKAAYNSDYWRKNKDSISAAERRRRERWTNEDYEQINSRRRADRRNNPEKYRLEYLRRRDAIQARRREYRKANIQFRLSGNLRGRLFYALSGKSRKGSAVKDLGCSLEELRKHLEAQFYSHPETGQPMTWENYGPKGWHIDHIKPFYIFDLTDPIQVKEVCHYTNLRPLWATHNLSRPRPELRRHTKNKRSA